MKPLFAQLGLFEGGGLMTESAPRPAPSRRTDPESSKSAGRAYAESGRHESDKDRVLRALREWWRRTGQPITAVELVREFHLGASEPEGQVMACKRLAELRRAGLAEVAGERECRVKGSLMQTWKPIETEA